MGEELKGEGVEYRSMTKYDCENQGEVTMIKLVLVRHGESTWNKENRFTGWTDVDLSEKGREEAQKAGRILKRTGL